ncbi:MULTISPECIES: hypothetical protein [Edwardsiella]|nr:hypothetical protein [Edwardsiella anguillarum]WHP88447.1 hypothetical protein MQ088_04170 [Edwardsiella anguillarum]WHP92248.1 hypothetical protein MQ091_04170 [Edwardsiella anguillarum]WHP96054.1 hypothetical protein MQ096_04170 [Edwardsiella anguillarum]WHQ03667.1 hypothetical protein MQ086_04170 [Edwardsiella anguillarum]WHQ07444.1 hypothetical protein MQ092_04170 [Edwardsiella anguillarum]
MMNTGDDRINQEWIALNAIRGMVKIASKGSMSKSTYDNALDLGGVLYPELLGPDNSLLRRERESDTTKEYRQKAELRSIKNEFPITALELVLTDIEDYESLISIARKNRGDKQKSDQLKRRLAQLLKAKSELEIKSHSENQLIFRDAYNAERNLPELSKGHAYKDFELPDGNYLRLRVLHPDRPEHITGADIIYERHNEKSGKISVVIVQYKIWEDKKLYISDSRMRDQIDKMRKFTCGNDICSLQKGDNTYRFPCCAGFLRPTDRLQHADQKFISTGEHLPICRINDCKSVGKQGGELLEYDKVKEVSLSAELFEELFNRGKVGSRELSRDELEVLYKNASVIDAHDTVVIYAQEF